MPLVRDLVQSRVSHLYHGGKIHCDIVPGSYVICSISN